MGFEDDVGPVPTRKEQLDMIRKLQDNWIAQPFYKYYMNQDLRRPKMAFADRLNKARSQLFSNLFLYGILFSPILVLVQRFNLTDSGLPKLLKLNYFEKIRSPKFARFKSRGVWGFGAWLALTTITASLNTNMYSYYGDEGYRYGAKPQKML